MVNMDIVKRYVDTVVVVGGIIAALVWMTAQINEVRRECDEHVSTQGIRTDKLYEMFIDLLKETRK